MGLPLLLLLPLLLRLLLLLLLLLLLQNQLEIAKMMILALLLVVGTVASVPLGIADLDPSDAGTYTEASFSGPGAAAFASKEGLSAADIARIKSSESHGVTLSLAGGAATITAVNPATGLSEPITYHDGATVHAVNGDGKPASARLTVVGPKEIRVAFRDDDGSDSGTVDCTFNAGGATCTGTDKKGVSATANLKKH